MAADAFTTSRPIQQFNTLAPPSGSPRATGTTAVVITVEELMARVDQVQGVEVEW